MGKEATAAEINGILTGTAFVEGVNNLEAARRADIVVLTVPYSAHRETLESVRSALHGKILVDVTVPLVPPKVTKVQMPAAGSAAQEAHTILGDGIEVTSAFHNISYEHLLTDKPVECDVLVAGTSREARLQTLRLVSAAGFTGWDAGPIENSVVLEGLTSVLTRESPMLVGEIEEPEEDVAFVADSYLLLRYVEIESSIRKALLVLKLRGSDHAKDIRQFEIMHSGIEVQSKFEGREGIMSGSPRRMADYFVEAFVKR